MYVIKSNRKTNSYTVRKINRITQVVRVGRRGLQGETGPQGPKGDHGDPATNLVQSVNGKQGVVVLNAADVGADPTGSASQALQDAKDYTDAEVSTLNSSLATVAKTGSYNDLSNKPTIPSIAGLATEQYVDNGLATKVDKEVGKGLSANDYTTLEKNKLAGIANNATANQTDSYLLNRTNHTGTQAQSTITNLTTDLAAKANASDTVNLTGNQTIAGVKTFTSAPISPSGTSIGGVLYLTGSGFPNGVVSASVGSIYIDKAITNGASSWIKKSGTGNTGWQVLEGDTEWREVKSLLTNGYTATFVKLRRVNNQVRIAFEALSGSAATSDSVLLPPLGFRQNGLIYTRPYLTTATNPATVFRATVGNNSILSLMGGTGLASAVYGDITWLTSEPWPTALPGTAY